VTVFAPPDAAEQAGVIRNPVAERNARTLLEQVWQRGAADADVRRMAADIAAARARHTQAKAAQKALRASQKDDRDLNVWSRGVSAARPQGGGRTWRGGY
jgi:hypothetical protein